MTPARRNQLHGRPPLRHTCQVDDGEWHHIASSIDGKVYVDGVLVDSPPLFLWPGCWLKGFSFWSRVSKGQWQTQAR